MISNMKEKFKKTRKVFLIFIMCSIFICTVNPAISLAANVDNPDPVLLPPLGADKTISDVFPDNAMANIIADLLSKSVSETITSTDLNQITTLSITDNQEIQSISGIGYLTNLTELYLQNDRKILYLPDEIGLLGNLTKAVFWYIPIQSLPRSVGYWSKLETISLWGCDLKTLPAQMGNWTALTYINCDGSYETAERTKGFLESIPNEISFLTLLNEAQFENNKITSLPQTMSSLQNLTKLDVSFNMLREKLPDFSAVTNLNTGNQISDYKKYTAASGSDILTDLIMPPILLQQKNDYNGGTLSGQGNWTVTKPDATKVTIAGKNGRELKDVFDQTGTYSVVFHVSNGDDARLNNSSFRIPVSITSDVPLTGENDFPYTAWIIGCLALCIVFMRHTVKNRFA